MLFIMVILISGCASNQGMWHHPTNSQSDFYRDSQTCESYVRQLEQVAENDDARVGSLVADATTNPYASPSAQNAYRDQQRAEYSLVSKLMRNLGSNNRYTNCMKSLGYHK